MNKAEIISFFDKMSAGWDDNMLKNQAVVDQILDHANVKQGDRVLDVACGTGVLIPDYLERNVKKIVGIDISPKMIEIAKEKYRNYNKIEFLIGDMEEVNLQEQFDVIIIYNSFPHFCHPEVLIEQAARYLIVGGTLCVAHGMSRAKIDDCHKGVARHVSNGLIHEDEMEKLFRPFFDVSVKISDKEMYIVVGKKR